MRHGYFGKKLSRNTNERKRLFMVLAHELIARGSITTTIAKAKAVQPMIEKLVTLAKRGSARQLGRALGDKKSAALLLSWGKSRFGSRISGFTRIVRLGRRIGDNSEAVVFSFIDARPAEEGNAEVKKEKREQDKGVKSDVAPKRSVTRKVQARKRPGAKK